MKSIVQAGGPVRAGLIALALSIAITLPTVLFRICMIARIKALDELMYRFSNYIIFDLGAIRYKLRKLLGVSVDVLTPGALPDKFRDSVIAEALTV